MRKFPLFRQHDSMQCGAACLQMICKYWGKDVSLDRLDHLCAASKEGVSVKSICDAATVLHLKTVSGYTTLDKLTKIELPIILHWEQKHFVVLYKVKKRLNGSYMYYVADPGVGLVRYSQDQFYNKWISTSVSEEEKGVVVVLQPQIGFKDIKDDKTSARAHSAIKILWSYTKKFKSYYWQIVVSLIVGVLIQLIFPFLTQSIVDIGIKDKDIGFVFLILMAQFVLILGSATTDFIRRWILMHVGMRVNISLISDFLIKLIKLPMKFFDIKLVGDILERMQDHKRVENFVSSQFLTVFFAFFSFLVLGAVLLIYNKLIFMIFLVGSIMHAMWLAVFLKKRRLLDYMLFERLSTNDNATYSLICNIQEIKLQNCEQRQRWLWEDTQVDTFKIQIKQQKLKQLQEAGAILLREAKNVLITAMAAYAVISGEMTLGMMLAVQFIIGQLTAPIDELMNFIYSLQDTQMSIDRINEIHQLDNEDSLDSLPFKDDMLNSNIKFSKVDFKYDLSAGVNVLNDMTLTIPNGKITAIVGQSGSGKSTLIKLLLGYYEPISGDICIGNVSLRSISKKDWRRQCGVVMQGGVIFPESIARNIAADDNEINQQQLIRAARIANIDTFIDTLPLKYDTMLGVDGVDMSQGQKQRLLIARAVYRNPSFIFLDEATNSLDTENERDIIRNLNEFYKNKTVIIVAHRLSTVKTADNIVVLNYGSIVEQGTHNELIQKEGLYYNLVKNQLEIGI